MKLLLSVLALAAIVLVYPADKTSAQETQLVVSPAIIELSVERGASEQVFLQITNTNENALPVSILAQAITVDGQIINGNVNERFDSSEWIIFDQETYVIESRKTVQIPFKVTAPFTAAPGGHYAQLSIRGLALESDNLSRGLVFPEVGVPILMTVSGEVDERAVIADSSLFPRIVQPNKPTPLGIEIENIGNVHNVVFPRIVITKDDQIEKEVNLNPEILLPGTKKTFNSEWLVNEFGQYGGYVTFRFGNMQEEVRSEPESIVAMPSLRSLTLLAALVWSTAYLYPRRNNIAAAFKVLFTD